MIVSESAVLVGGVIAARDRIGLALADPELEDAACPNAFYVVYDRGHADIVDVRPTASIGMAQLTEPPFEFFSLRADGVMTKFSRDSCSEETISSYGGK